MPTSVRVYFPKSIEELPNGVFRPMETVFPGDPRFLFCGVLRLASVPEGYYLYENAVRGRYVLPDEARVHVSYCMLVGTLLSYPTRQRGVYRHPGDETVTATLDREGGSYAFFGKHVSLERLYELLDLVRAGTIVPAESWDAPQVLAPPAPDQAALLQAARADITVLAYRLEAVEAEVRALQAKQAELPALVADRLRKEVAALGDFAFELAWDGANAIQSVLGSERMQGFFRRVRP